MVASVLLLAACAAGINKSTVSVSVSGVNYTDKDFAYVVVDPIDEKNGAGGESVSAYGAGGTMCCYTLPAQWKPGIKVKVKLYDDYEKLTKEVVAEVPPYVDGKPGQLWAVVHADGSVEAVSSDVTPKHEKWPGKVKGWPVPSVEHRRKLWQLDMDEALLALRDAEHGLKILPTESAEGLKESWDLDWKYSRKDVIHLKGPGDPAYREYLKKSYEIVIEATKEQIRQLERINP
jgi:hypothetical protein